MDTLRLELQLHGRLTPKTPPTASGYQELWLDSPVDEADGGNLRIWVGDPDREDPTAGVGLWLEAREGKLHLLIHRMQPDGTVNEDPEEIVLIDPFPPPAPQWHGFHDGDRVYAVRDLTASDLDPEAEDFAPGDVLISRGTPGRVDLDETLETDALSVHFEAPIHGGVRATWDWFVDEDWVSRTPPGRRILARFHPQAWVNDYAVEIDLAGPTEWDVTEAILAMGREPALALEDDQYETDDLRFLPTAPRWIQAWDGPFWVEVEQAIRDYFETEEEG